MALSAEEFKRQLEETPAIKEVFQEVSEWIPQLQMMLEDPDNTFSEKDYEQFRGSLKAVRNMLNLGTVVYERKKLDEEKGEANG